jgi:prepilin-type N-terminal cleavage/methylation domain-containing protein
MRGRTHAQRGFSLIELVVVVVIVGILAAIAIPRLSRGSAGAADSSLSGNLAVMRKAIDMYASEHGGSYPTAANFASAMTQYTDVTGATITATPSATCIYGPYLRSIPPLPVGAMKGQTGVAAASAATVGWIYTASSGLIAANATESDVSGKAYSAY